MTPPEQQDSYGTAAPARPKKKHTGLIVFLCLTCTLLASALTVISLMHLRIDLTGGKISFRTSTPSEGEDAQPDDRQLQPNEAAQEPTHGDRELFWKVEVHGQQPQEEALSVQALYETASPGVVCVLSDGGTTCGTGIVIGENGLLLTSVEYVDGYETTVLCADGTEGTARLIGYDRTTGFALLSGDLKTLKPLRFGDTESLKVGDTVYCIGNPYGSQMRNTLSEGLLTGIGSSSVCGRELKLLSSDAVFDAGQKGCPLFDCAGNVIGVTSGVGAGLTGNGGDPGFAVGAADVQRIAQEILTAAANGENRWLGYDVEDIPQTYLYYYGFPGTVWITEVGADTYAYGALNRYDVILDVNGIPITTAAEYEQVLASYEIGDILELRIFRGGIYYRIELPLTEK